MPSAILTPQDRRALSTLPDTVDEYALARYFTLTRQDRQAITRHYRGDHNRLGFACHLSWLRYLGWQPQHFTAAQQVTTAFLAQQLHLSPDGLARYTPPPRMWRLHALQAREYLGWRAYHAPEAQLLATWLLDEALQRSHARGLFDSALSYLRREQIVRPGLTVLERLVVEVRGQAETHLAQRVNALLTDDEKQQLDELLMTPTRAGEVSPLQRLKDPPGSAAARNLLALLDKIETVRALGFERVNLSALNPNRRKTFAREAARLFPVELRRLEPSRRYLLLACLLAELLRNFNDQAVEMHDQLLRETAHRAEGRHNKELIQRKEVIHQHLGLLRAVVQVFLDEEIADTELRSAIFRLASQDEWREVLQSGETLIQPQSSSLAFLSRGYSYVRQFGPRFMATLSFRATQAGQAVLQGVEYLRRLDAGEQAAFDQPPMEFVPRRVRTQLQAPDGQVNRRLWELALHEQLAQALRAGDVWIEHSTEHAPLALELQVPQVTRAAFVQRNPHLASSEQFLQDQHARYLETLKQANTLWPTLGDVRIEAGQLHLSPLPAEAEPEGTEALRKHLHAWMPRRKLTQVFREVLHWVDYLQPLRAAVGDDVRIQDLDERLLALLMAEGCNIGLSNMAAATPGLTYLHLAHVAGRCLGDDVLEQAIARVIRFYDQRLPITRVWGEGVWSSADGQLFPVPVKTLYARLHPRAAKGKRVLNLFTYVYDRLMPYWGRVIQTTAHESAFAIDGLLHNEADLYLRKQATDTAGYTDAVFGLTSLLSIFYAPRIKDLADQRLFFFDPEDPQTFAHVGPLLVARINQAVIEAQWTQLIEVATAVEQGLMPASRVLRKLEAGGERSDVYRALREVGRIAKTTYLLNYLTDSTLRRQVARQLNKTETYHSLIEVLSWGNKGEMRLAQLQDQVNRASCLRLVASIVMLFNAAYLQNAVQRERAAGREVPEASLRHIFPTLTAHIGFLGDYSFRDDPALATQFDDLPLVEPVGDQVSLEGLGL